MATLDISVVNIALPTLSRTFGVPLTTIEWVVLAYVVTITGLLLAFGRLADRRGRRTIYGVGLAIFTAASALCGAAPSAHGLIAARALQGLGAAMMSANSAALLISAFGPEERGKALGAFGAMVGVGLALGPPLGGFILGHFSWRWIFFLNLPLGVLAWLLLRARVPADPAPRPGGALDVAGALAWCVALVALMLGLSRGPAAGWRAASVWPLFPIAAAALAAFVAIERRVEARGAMPPLLPIRLLAGPLGVAVFLTLTGQALSIAVGFHLPLYLEEVLGFDALKSGSWLAVLPVAALLCAPLAGALADRLGTRPLAAFGMALTAVGLWLISHVGVAPHPAQLIGGMVLVGVGQGLFAVPNSSALLSTVPAGQLGIASGLQATTRNLGIATGAAVMAALVATRYAAQGGGPLGAGGSGAGHRLAFAAATHDAYLVWAAVAGGAAVLAWVQPGSRAGVGNRDARST